MPLKYFLFLSKFLFVSSFSIKFKNSFYQPIMIWLSDQPICNYNDYLCKQGNNNCLNNVMYPCTTDSWQRSIGLYQIVDNNNNYLYNTNTPKKLTFRNLILQPNEIWQIILPIKNNLPYWCFTQNNNFVCSGVNSWVTSADSKIIMTAPQGITLFEYNVNAYNGVIFYDASAVDGLNTNHELYYLTNNIATNYIKCNIDFNKCPNNSKNNIINSCVSPKWWNNVPLNNLDISLKNQILNTNNNNNFYDYCFSSLLNKGSNYVGCGYGDKVKACCHLWWSTNTDAQSWLNYIKSCNIYGWAYDEMKWQSNFGFDNYNLNNFNPVYKIKNNVCNDGSSPDSQKNCFAVNSINPLRVVKIDNIDSSININIISVYKLN